MRELIRGNTVFGKNPMQTLLDSNYLADEKMLDLQSGKIVPLLEQVKRKQALVETNLSGIACLTSGMIRGSKRAPKPKLFQESDALKKLINCQTKSELLNLIY